MSSFSWKGEEKVTWHGMEVRRLNGPSMNVDITNDYEAAAAAASVEDYNRGQNSSPRYLHIAENAMNFKLP